MNPLHLRLRNVGTWRELDLPLPEGILALTGGNGAGKSTIVNSIEAALFGPEGRSFEALYPRGGAGEGPLVIELVFEHGGHEYRVRRSYSPKGRGTSKTDLEEGDGGLSDHDGRRLPSSDWRPLTLESQTETQAMIEELVGITRDTFRASSFVRQTEVGRFCEATAGKRKAILADALGLEEWERWLGVAREWKRALEGDLAHMAGTLQAAEADLETRAEVVAERDRLVEQQRSHEEGLREAVSAALSARDALTQASGLADRRTAAVEAERAAQRLIEDLEKDIWARDEEIWALDTRLAQRERLETDAAMLPDLREERDNKRRWHELHEQWRRLSEEERGVQAAQRALFEKVQTLQARATEVLDAIGAEKCDRCGQVLNEDAAIRAAESYRAEAHSHGEEIDRLQERADAITAELKDLPDDPPDGGRLIVLEELIPAYEQAARELAALEEAAQRRTVAKEEAERMRAGLPERQQAVAAARAQLEALGPHDPDEHEKLKRAAARTADTESNLRHRLDVFKASVARADERLERLDRVAAERADLLTERDKIQADLDLAIAMEKACGANGVPALIMENVAIPQLEVEATRILGFLDTPAYAVELRSQKSTKAGGVSDTLDVMLLTDAGEAPFEAFSGGERASIAFAVRLALAQLLAARRGSATGILVIDEIEGLDAHRIAALVTVLEEMQRSVPRILVVSHQIELRDAFAQSLALENVGGRSRLVGGVDHVVERALAGPQGDADG